MKKGSVLYGAFCVNRYPPELSCFSRRSFLDELAQTALGAAGNILVDQVLGCCFVETASGRAKFRLSLLKVATRYGFADFLDLSSQGGSGRAISNTMCFALAKTFLGTAGIWHVKR
jgi:hypothetical protein